MRQAIMTKYMGPTNHRGARIKAWAYGGTITIGWDYSLDTDENHQKAAMALVKKLGWEKYNDFVGGALPKGYGYVFVAVEKKRGKK